MKRIYNIADIKLLIKTNFEYIESKQYKNFCEVNSIYDVVCDFKNIKKSLVFKTKPICKDISLNIYHENGEIYRVMHREVKNSEYLCLKKDKYKKNLYNCYIYNDGQKFLNEDKDIFNTLGIEKILNDFGVIYLHASFIKWNDKGVLFTAPCGTGKSTQANLWQKYEEADIINGDKTLIRKKEGVWRAYGSPYAGSSEIYVNDNAPIKSIVVLRQASENKLEKLSKKDAFKWILSETTINFWDDDFTNRAVDLVLNLVEEIPVYMLSCRPDKEAVELLKKEIQGECEMSWGVNL